MNFKVFISLFIVLITSAANAGSGIVPESPAPITITIGTGIFGPQKLLDTVEIMLLSGGNSIAGADLKIGLDAYGVEILEILRGEIVDSCQWELFETKASIDQGKNNSPRSLWTILALSDFMPDSAKAVCFGLERPASIARLVVSVDSSKVRIVPDTLFPIYFFWEDCTDNTVTNSSGNLLYMSLITDGVALQSSISADSGRIIPPGTTPAGAMTLPSRFGNPEICINPRAQNKPIRKLIFQSGGARLKSVVDKLETKE